MITTADWLRYIDSLGPTADRESLRMRLEAAGADADRAAWLVGLVRRFDIARKVARVAIVMLIIGISASAYQWWLALTGAANAPQMRDAAIVAIVIGAGSLALLFASAVQLSPPLDLLAFREVPAELAPPPRPVSGRRQTVPIVGLSFAVVSLMLAPFALAVIGVRDHVWLRDHGIETTGHVTRTFTTKGSKGSTNYHVAYEFDRGDGVKRVSHDAFSQYHEGDSIRVTYLPSDPSINDARPKAEITANSGASDPVAIGLTVYFIAVGILVAVLIMVRNSMQRSLAAIGVATVAEVTYVSRQMVEYRFGDRKGRFRWAKRAVRERPDVGQPLVILYDPDKPKRTVPLGALPDVEFRT